MEDEIKVGELVRTRNKGIQKIAYLRPNATVNKYAYFIGYDDDGDRLNGILKTTDIIKHSFDIKDLIEAGDILQTEFGKYEVVFDKSYEKLGILIPHKSYLAIRHSSIEHIFNECKTVKIVTKEQFEPISYKVKE